MTHDEEKPTGHERFLELGALANTGTLTLSEWVELRDHLQICADCREIHDQYLTLINEGIPLLAGRYGHCEEHGAWDEAAAWQGIASRLQRADEVICIEKAGHLRFAPQRIASTRVLLAAAVAACLVVAVGLASYRLGNQVQLGARQAPPVQDASQGVEVKKKSLEAALEAQTRTLSQLQQKIAQKEHELSKLRTVSQALIVQADQLGVNEAATETQLRDVSNQRDALSDQLRDAQQAYLNVKAEVVRLRAEGDKVHLQLTSLESTIGELNAISRANESRMSKDEQYLADDRDIRELMGARKLYIADVFDVDSNSRTRKPFGRIFYTQGESLIFYAFDLDHQPGVKNAVTFQAWGRKEVEQGKPLNLGILYMDSESNRRWALRFNDPKQLEEIDAVFVTVEPYGGSRKPTSKPFLYALLRKEANHP